MRFRFLLILVFSFSATGAFAQYQELLHKTYAERYVRLDSGFYAGKVLKLDSVAMFAELDKLAETARPGNDEELLLETRHMKAIYYMVGPQQDHKKGEARMLALRELADSKKILQLQIRTRERLAYYYFYIAHQYGPAFENYLRAYELLKDVPAKDFPEKQELIAAIGSAYFNFGDNTNARRYFAIAQKIPHSYKKRFPINLQNTIGLIYRAEHNYLQAERCFRKAYEMARANHDSTWMGIAAGNIGISYFHQQKYNEATPLLTLDVRQSFKASEIDNALTSLIYLIKINQLLKRHQLVTEHLAVAWKLLSRTGSPLKHRRELYAIMAQQQAAEANYFLAYRYTDSSGMMKDSLYSYRNAALLAGAEKKIEIEKYHVEMAKLEAQDNFRELWIASLLVGLLLLLIIAILIISRQRLLYREKQHQLRSEKEAVESELQGAIVKLDDFTGKIRVKRRLIEKVEAELARLQSVSGNSQPDGSAEALLQLQQATILTDQQWEEFRHFFEKVHKGFMQRLKEKIPSLSPAETRFMVLGKLGFCNKEMAATLGITPEAIRLTRHRLRKKLALSETESLESLIGSV
jgi:tetratricopeptide (TPR) repeat protein